MRRTAAHAMHVVDLTIYDRRTRERERSYQRKYSNQMQQAVAGFSESTVRALSAARQEPEWMLELRLAAWQTFEAMPWPKVDRRSLAAHPVDWLRPGQVQPRCACDGDAPDRRSRRIQHELDEMDSAASLVFQDGVVIYRTDTRGSGGPGRDLHRFASAVTDQRELVQKYFMTEVVKPDHNKFTALHAALVGYGRVYLCAQKRQGRIAVAGDPQPGSRRRRRLSSHAVGRRRRGRSHRGR